MASDEIGATTGRWLVAVRRFHDGLDCAAQRDQRKHNERRIEDGSS